jgi:hypothetical protein
MTQVTAAPSLDYALAAMVLAAASITNPEYVPTDYQTFLLTVFIMILHALFLACQLCRLLISIRWARL